MRNALAYVPKTQQSMVATALRQAFLQPDRAQASQMLRRRRGFETAAPRLPVFRETGGVSGNGRRGSSPKG
jgi:transposase-like protein